MEQKYFVLVLLLVSVLAVSGCVSPNEPTNPEEPENQNTIGTFIPDLENQLTEKPWRFSGSRGAVQSSGSIRLVLKKGLFGNAWEYGSKANPSSGKWELVDLTEEDLKNAELGLAEDADLSKFANKIIILYGWARNPEGTASLIELEEDRKTVYKILGLIKDYNAESNELI